MSDLSKLLARWNARDARYGIRKSSAGAMPLSKDEAMSIRAYRRSEVEDLPILERGLAEVELDRWAPPPVSMR